MLDDPARLEFLPPGEVVSLLDAPQGGLVVDFGTGTGLYALELSRLRPDLDIAALDEQEPMLSMLRAKLRSSACSRVRPILTGTPDAAALIGRADRIVALNVLHELSDEALAALKALLGPEGRALFVDWNSEVERPSGPPREHVYSPREARKHLAGLGWSVGPERLFPFHYALTANQPLRTMG